MATQLDAAAARAKLDPDTAEPAWDVARLFPRQGNWTQVDFLELSDRSNRLIELSNGRLEVLPMPTPSHQQIVAYLYRTLFAFVIGREGGRVLFSPMPILLWPGQFREPDLMFMGDESDKRIQRDFWEGADLVMEVVSDSNREHDLVTKRGDYAQAGMPEYWIVDPIESRIIVLTLPPSAREYAVHGTFEPGQKATSALLPGFEVDVAAAFNAAR